jgi:formate dehydrogenase major subunit
VVQQTGFDIDSVRYPKGKRTCHWTPRSPTCRLRVGHSHPYMVSDLESCINCYRCVRACDEVQGEMVLTMAGRGFDSWIAKGTGESFKDSDCVSCGACAQACPTSAITDVFKSKETKADEVVRTVCTYCGVGCNLEVKVKDNKVVAIRALRCGIEPGAHLLERPLRLPLLRSPRAHCAHR